MQKEKISAIILVVIVVVALFAYIGTKEDLFKNLFGPEPEEVLTVELGDCVDLYYIGKLANGTIFDSSYEDPENKINGTLLNVYVTKDSTASSPSGYEEYMAGMIEGFIDGMIGLKEGQAVTIGPILPEKAYGKAPEIDDELIFSYPGSPDQVLVIKDIKENIMMPSDFIDYFGDANTTIFVLRNKIEQGEKITLYATWENATEYIFVNETTAYLYTTPPDDKMSNFTWFNATLGIPYWENASSIASINDTTIVVQHNPHQGDTVQDTYFTTYTVLNLSLDKINCSYQNPYTGNTSFILFDRVEKIQRNETLNLTIEYPLEVLEYFISQAIYYGIDVEYSFGLSDLAGETLYFDVVIEKVYKTSQES